MLPRRSETSPSHHSSSASSWKVLLFAIRQEKERQNTQIGKKEIKLSSFTDDMTFYVENMKEATEKLLEQISDNSKVVGYKSHFPKYQQ